MFLYDIFIPIHGIKDERLILLQTVDTITMSDVESRDILWLWEPYIPSGAVTILSGDGGQGKSYMALAIASAVTRGLPLPGCSSALPPSDVIIQNAENPLATVIKPRLEMLNADCSKVHIINEADKRLTITDDRIESAIVQHNAKFLVLDPYQSYSSEFSMNRAESVRMAVTHLEHIAERTGCSCLLVGHLNKSRGKTNYRGLGSVDFFNSVPSVLYLGKMDDDDDIRAVAHGKSNLTELGASQAFSLNKTDGFRWLGECDVTAEELLQHTSSGAKVSKMTDAIDFLSEALAAGEVPAGVIMEEASQNGISVITLKRAKGILCVKSRKDGEHWMWSL